MTKTLLKPTPTQVLACLPDEPEGYYFSVEQMSPLIMRVWLHHKKVYDYNLGEPVKTIWGFIKSGRVHPPKNTKTPNPKSVCDLLDAWKLPGYTSYTHNVTSLQHLS